MNDRATDALMAALKQALAEPGEHRLYRGGKLAGLFAGRGGPSGGAAAQALRDGLLEVTRTETKGRVAVEWARLTPKGVEFLHAHESPLAVLRELQSSLRTTRAGVPVWLEAMRQQWQAFSQQMHADMEQMLKRLDALAERVEEALRRSDAIGPALPPGVSASVPWAIDALTYLDHRRDSGATEDCPLPELFAAIRQQHPQLSLVEFQDGLRRLLDHKALRLLPFRTNNGELPEPEYVMCEGPDLLYYASR
ncbi:MAG: hypothetical protein ACJ8F7_08660 [Gemmataceae bacterium]